MATDNTIGLVLIDDTRLTGMIPDIVLYVSLELD